MIDAVGDGGRCLLTLTDASRVFRMGEVQVRALVDVSLQVRDGEFMVIHGPSGSGKSTLLNLIGGMDQPTGGRVVHRQVDLTRATDAELTAYRRQRIGFVFQFYNLVPTLTAYENVQVATELVADPLDPSEALTMVELIDRADHFPSQLSGGEQQRVAIARALAKKPELLLADEPTGALDLATSQSVLALLQRLNREQKLTIILITHNPAITEIADRTVRIVSGRIADITVNEQPADAATVSW